MNQIFYTDLPCLFWPASGDSERPEPFTGGDYPTFILNTTHDPATPTPQGIQVFSQIPNAYMITQEGGPHVVFGRYVECVDDPIAAFILEGTEPELRDTYCEEGAGLFDGYVAIPSADGYTDNTDLFRDLFNELTYHPDYLNWDLETPTTTVCTYGGTMSFEGTDVGEALTFEDCALIPDLPMNGTGVYDYETGVTFELTFAEGDAVTLVYDYETITVTGTFQGEAIDLNFE
jgi:hypothetical protein